MKKICNYGSIIGFLIICLSLFSCVKEPLDEFENLNEGSKLFLEKLKVRPNWNEEWQKMQQQGNPSLDNLAFAMGGNLGCHYVLPLLKGKAIEGLALYPLENVNEDGDLKSAMLANPVILDKQGIDTTFCARMFLRSKSFETWKERGLKLEMELSPWNISMLPHFEMPKKVSENSLRSYIGTEAVRSVYYLTSLHGLGNECIIWAMSLSKRIELFHAPLPWLCLPLDHSLQLLHIDYNDVVLLVPALAGKDVAMIYYSYVESLFLQENYDILFAHFWSDYSGNMTVLPENDIIYGGGSGGGSSGGNGNNPPDNLTEKEKICNAYNGIININSLKNSKNKFTSHQEQFIIGLANLAALYQLGYNLDNLKQDLVNYPTSSNLYTKYNQLNNHENYTNGWAQAFNSYTKKNDALVSGNIGNSGFQLKFYPTKDGGYNALGLVKDDDGEHRIEAALEFLDGFLRNVFGKDDLIYDMHLFNALNFMENYCND